jgi:hypothetical protein
MPTQTPQEKPGPLEPSSALISALPTEHYVLQSAISANTSEVGTRASLYLFSLSSSLAALGFASRSPELFVPFVAIVLPAIFILGLFTAVRLVDSNLEGVGVAMLAGGLLRENRTVVASLIGAGVALVLMALFFVYQKWRYDSTTAHMQEQEGTARSR